MPMPKHLTLYLKALAAVALWGASFPLSKAALAYTSPTGLAFLRWALSAAALACWLGWSSRRRAAQLSAAEGVGAAVRRLFKQDGRTVIWVALSGVTLFYWAENAALQYTTAINAGVLSNLTAVFMVLIAIATLGERLRGGEWLAMAAAFAGAVLVSQGAGHLTLGGSAWIGDLLMAGASLLGAVYSIDGKRLAEKHPAAAVMTVVAAVGAAFLLPLALLEGLRLDLPAAAWGFILLLGLGSGALANLWWLTILAQMTASRAAQTLFLVPVISTALAVFLLNEPLTLTMIVGSILVLGGVMVVQRKGVSV